MYVYCQLWCTAHKPFHERPYALGFLVTHAIIVYVWKKGILVSELEPDVSEQFYADLEKAK